MTDLRFIVVATFFLSCLFAAEVEGQKDSSRKTENTNDSKALSDGPKDRSSFAERRDQALRVFQNGTRNGRTQAVRRYEEIARDAKEQFSAPAHPDGHDEIILSLRDLAATYSVVGRMRDAIRTQREAYGTCLKLYPDGKSSAGIVMTAHSLVRLAMYHGFDGNRKRFAEFLDKAEELISSATIEPTFEAAFVQMELAVQLTQAEKIESARKLCLGAARTATRLTGELSEQQQNDIVGLYSLCGSTLYGIADLTEARKYAAMAVELAEDLPLDLVRDNKAGALQCLGACHSELGEYDQAIPILKSAYTLYEPTSPGHASQIAIQIASAYRRSRKFDEAERWLAVSRKARARNSVDPILYLYEEAALYTARGNYDDALKSHERALRRLRTRPSQSRQQSNIYSAMAQLEIDRGNKAAAAALFRKVWQSKTAFLYRLLPTASEASALNYMRHYWRTTERYLHASRAMTEPSQIRKQYELVSQQRGLVVRALSLRHKLRQNLSTERVAIYNDYVAAANQLSTLLDGGNAARPNDRIQDIQTRKDLLELQLVENIPGLGDSMRSLHVPLSDVQKALADHELLVDFVRYRSPEGEGAYAVFVVSVNNVRRHDVDDALVLEQKIHAWRKSIASHKHGDLLSKELYRFLWSPLEKFVPDGVKTVYICSDSALCLTPWSALKGDDEKILLERYALASLPYPQYLLRRAEASSRKSGGQVLAVGNIDYGVPPQSGDPSLRAAPAWQPLQHTQFELRELKSRAEAAGAKVTQLDGTDATTDNVLSELPGATWAHFATHGFFSGKLAPAANTQPQRTSPSNRNPLVSNGLVLAGANLVAGPGGSGNVSGSRGRLNGAAICNLDLHKTDLVFLSACDTGIGNVFDGEGVFGFQRAFHVAGARNVVCSLWKVDDAATALLVRNFYENYWSGNLSALQSLRQVQLAIYRNPLLIEGFRKSRGIEFKPLEPIQRSTPTSPPVLWSGFIFSGVEPSP